MSTEQTVPTRHRVVVVAHDVDVARRYAELLGGQDLVVSVRNKYLAAAVELQPIGRQTDDSELPAPDTIAGVIQLAPAHATHVATHHYPKSLFYVVAVLGPAKASALQSLENQGIDQGFEVVPAAAGGSGFEPVALTASTAGLLGAELCGPSRVAQLLHQTMWRDAPPITESHDEPSSTEAAVAAPLEPRTANELLVVGAVPVDAWAPDVRSAIAGDGAAWLASGDVFRLTTKYYAADIKVRCVAFDDARAAIRAVEPRVILTWCANSETIAAAASFFNQLQSVEDVAAEAQLCVTTCAVSPPTTRALFDLGVETIELLATGTGEEGGDFDVEDGARGKERLLEVIECCSWRQRKESKKAEPPVAVPQAVERTPQEAAPAHASVTAPATSPDVEELVFIGIGGVTTDDIMATRKACLGHTNGRATITTPYGASEIRVASVRYLRMRRSYRRRFCHVSL
jgi:hypothetical protein